MMGRILSLVLLAGLAGCSTCGPDYCAECPVRVELVPSPPEIITVVPPAVVVPTMPTMESLEQLDLAATDPAAWLRLVAQDLLELRGAMMAARAELMAVNASRPDGG